MEAGEHQLAERRRPAPLVFQPPTQVNGVTSGNASLLDPLELEALMLNMDASLKVHARHHFFTWTQGLLQNLLKHEMLICALRNSKLTSFHVDSFATSPAEPAPFSESGRGERRIEFRAIPQNSTIRIYTVRGDLVQTLRQGGSVEGFVAWNLRTKDNLDVAPGLYIYRVESPGVGSTIGKFAIIK